MHFIYDRYKDQDFIYIKNDDDCIINLDLLMNNLEYITKHDYVGELIHSTEDSYNPNWHGLSNKSKYNGPYMNGGSGYILSKKALSTIVNSKKLVKKLLKTEFYEDKLIGDILRLHDFKIYEHPLWKSVYTKYDKTINFLKDNAFEDDVMSYNNFF